MARMNPGASQPVLGSNGLVVEGGKIDSDGRSRKDKAASKLN